jgi:hypothetical protein
VKSWGPLSRHRTAEGGRGLVHPTRRMPRLHSHRAPGRISESDLPVQPSELRRLFTTFGYLVAKQGATAALGLAYWAVTTRLFSARDVGLAAAASSTAFFLGAIGALGIPLLLLAELESLPAAIRRVTFSTGMYIACLAVLILSLATLALSPFLGDSLRIIGADSTTAALFVIGSVARKPPSNRSISAPWPPGAGRNQMAGHCPLVRSGILARTSTRASTKVNPAVCTVPDPKLLLVGREQMTEPVQEYPAAVVPR